MVKGAIRYSIAIHTFLRGPECELYLTVTPSAYASVQLSVRISIAEVHTQIDILQDLRHVIPLLLL
jgi:hypothetical protein